ncbi:hypothetical protein N431DRAFT_21981 [Stipitochalara longipes BDJ]|nr:hypothetical protein N431DRAFT_21981 [Stipitochalara longipes BDJ]
MRAEQALETTAVGQSSAGAEYFTCQARSRTRTREMKASFLVAVSIDLILCFLGQRAPGRGAISSLNRRKLLEQVDPKDLEPISSIIKVPMLLLKAWGLGT